MLEGLSPLHLILILAIVLIIVGPRRLPELGSALGKTLREFRDATSGPTEPTLPAEPTPPVADESTAPTVPVAAADSEEPSEGA